ncbi:uncharacterized protein At5g48480-like [Tasmannia lanceolata]|uniref:uncharacterized protein At5g48480-like n=1 Tax=Tasmannia lanceolata TaxID=3420 RepID=UPI0040647AE0
MAQENVVSADHQNGGAENGSSKGVSFFSLKPQLFVQAPKASDAIQFYKAAFGAEELKREMHPKRKADQELPLILSADLKLGSSVFIVSDHNEDAVKINGCGGFGLCLETKDVSGAFSKAVEAGAAVEAEITEDEDGCCGARVGKLKDPFGYIWTICSITKADVEA